MAKYRFDEFELDVDAMQLLREGSPIRLEKRPLDLLVLLVERRGRLVGREEIIATLWPPRVVIDFDAGLNTLVRKIRRALGDTADTPRFVETLPGRGYRFIANVVAESEPALPASTRTQPAPAGTKRMAAFGAVLLAVAAGALLISFAWHPASDMVRLAVLPFENLSGDANLDYLAFGLAEDTSTSLSQIDLPDLRVIGYASARAIQRADRTVQETGRELGVDFLVMSSLRQDATRIRVNARLVRVNDATQLWSASFDRQLTNVLGLQRELSVAIAEQVRLRLSPEVAAAIDRRQTQNPRAYELYLKGRDRWNQATPVSVREAIQLFQQATLEDPGYALAWAGIAHAASTSLMVADADPRTVTPLARNALQQALRLDPDLAETQYALSYFHLFVERDLISAEPPARRALTLDPNSATAAMLLGMILEHSQPVEARLLLKRARELDPMLSLIWANSAKVARDAGEPAEALEYARQAIAIGPDHWVGYFHLGNTLLAAGDEEAALEAYADAARLSGGNSKPLSARAYLLIRMGRTEAARAMLADMTARAARQYFPPYALAVVHAGLGEIDEGLAALTRAVAVGDVHLFDLEADPRLEPLRQDPRFSRLRHGSSAPADPSG